MENGAPMGAPFVLQRMSDDYSAALVTPLAEACLSRNPSR